MIVLPMLFALIAQDADRLPDPVAADSATIFYGPSRSLLSVTASEYGSLPATPVTLRFQCLVDAHTGEPRSCIPLEGGAAPLKSRAEFGKRATAWAQSAASASPATRVAMTRVYYTRVRPTASGTHDPANPVLVPMLFSQTVSAADAPKLDEPLGLIDSRDMEMDERPSAELLTAYYPAQALREGVAVRMRATCRVQPDRMLLCRDAAPAPGEAALSPELGRQFTLSTYQVLGAIRLLPLTKKGDPVVGRDLEVRIGFVLPE